MNKNSPILVLLTVLILLLVSVLPVMASTDTASDSAALLSSELASNQHEDQGVKFSSDPIFFSDIATIDFENLSEWTVISDQYIDLGVIFSGDPQILTAGQSLNVEGYPPRSGINVAGSFTDGRIQANFTNPVSDVEVYYWSKDNLYLDAYDANGTLIETKTGIPDTDGYNHGPIMYNLNISNKSGISSIVINGAANYYVIDDFSFTTSTSPVAEFSASPTSGKAPLTVKFTDKSTGSPTSWKWSFGDGTSSTQQNPTHKYSKVGSYTVKLTAANGKDSNTVTKTNYIKAVTKPVASFSAKPTSGKAPLMVAFADKSTGIPTSWKWSFGDGASSSEQSPKHQYLQEGNYKVTLTVTNVAGSNTVTKTNFIKVTTNTRPGLFSEKNKPLN
ncbi:PKD domain-containing protein [Methanosarcina sp. UBA411]|jgi:PKD repeat protein|uniref:PKD domain-containing protein n=1 Tax=Methanosarcina sp. UBA411 TaxID=1915589 RepID=UPI0037442659